MTFPVNDAKRACFHTQALPTSVIFPALTLTEAMTFNSTLFLFDLKLIIQNQVHSPAIFGEAHPEFSHDAKYSAGSLLSWPLDHTSKERRKLSCFYFYFKEEKYQVIWLIRSAVLFCPFI